MAIIALQGKVKRIEPNGAGFVKITVVERSWSPSRKRSQEKFGAALDNRADGTHYVFHDIRAKEDMPQLRFIREGDVVFVAGKIQEDAWLDNSGSKKSRRVIYPTDISSVPNGGENRRQASEPRGSGGDLLPDGLGLPRDLDDDLPF